MEKSKSFEEYYREVELIVGELERGNLTLSEILEKYEKAVKSLAECYKILHQTEKKIEVLRKNFEGEFFTEPFSEGKNEENSAV